MIKISWNEFLIGSSISLGGALLVGYAATRIATPITEQKTPPKQTVTKASVKTKVKQRPKETPEQTKAVVSEKELVPTTLVPLSKGDDQFPLKLGSKGQRVWKLRVYLLRHHAAQGIVSDELTPKAITQLRKYLKVETVDERLYNKLIDPIKTIR